MGQVPGQQSADWLRSARVLLIPWLLVAILLSTIKLSGQDSDELAAVKLFRFKVDVRLAELDKPLYELNARYRNYLGDQLSDYQNAGDAKGVAAVAEELRTFEERPSEALSALPELRRLQEIYRTSRSNLEKESVGPKLKWIRVLKEEGETLAGELTGAGKREEATQARVEVKRLDDLEKALVLIGDGKVSGLSNGDMEDGYVVIYPVSSENEIGDPAGGNAEIAEKYHIIEADQSRGRLLLEFDDRRLGDFQNPIVEMYLAMDVGEDRLSDTNAEIQVHLSGNKVVGSRQGAKKGEKLRIDLSLRELEEEEAFDLEVTCGNNAVLIEDEGPERPRLLVKFR